MSNLPIESLAVLVVDMQKALFEQKSPIYNATQLLDNINILIEQAHHANVPIVFLQHINKGILKKDSQGWQIHPYLKTDVNDLFFEKQHGSAFQETALHDVLRLHSITALIVCGLTTHGCVKSTCKDAIQHGYRVVLVQDGHSSYHQEADRLITEWNHKLSEMGIELRYAAEIDISNQ